MIFLLWACSPSVYPVELVLTGAPNLVVDLFVDGQSYRSGMTLTEGEHTLSYQFPLCDTQTVKIQVEAGINRIPVIPYCLHEHHGIEWSWIPAGRFSFGSPLKGEVTDADEGEQRITITNSFWSSTTEIPQALYQKVNGENPALRQECSRVREPMEGNDQFPAYCIDWFEALEFANELSKRDKLIPCYRLLNEAVLWKKDCSGYRLPTEIEWEYMATAQERWMYAGSSQSDEVAWTVKNSNGVIHPIGQLKANAWGLHDMSGNLWEWTWDRYETNATPKPDRELRGGLRVIRGGSWYKEVSKARIRDRANFHPAYRTDVVGIRLIREIPKVDIETDSLQD